MAWVSKATDTFTRADENPLSGGGNWTNPTSGGNNAAMKIVSNAVVPVATGGDSIACWTARAWANDQYSKCVVTVGAGTIGSGPGLCLRCTYPTASTVTCYRIVIVHASPAIDIGRWNADAFTHLSSTLGTGFTDGDTLEARVTGQNTATTIEILINGVSQGTYTDNAAGAINSGSPGLGYSSTVAAPTMDTWEGGEFVADAGVPVAWLRA